MRTEFQERKAERGNDGRKVKKRGRIPPRYSIHGRVETKGEKGPQKARRALGCPQNAQEEGDASNIAANALTSGKTPKMHDF